MFVKIATGVQGSRSSDLVCPDFVVICNINGWGIVSFMVLLTEWYVWAHWPIHKLHSSAKSIATGPKGY